MDLDRRPYMETHRKGGRKETGVVFFQGIKTARTYQQANRIDAAVISFPDPKLAVEASLVKWGCNVAYHVTQLTVTVNGVPGRKPLE
jgi:hypothetical protein